MALFIIRMIATATVVTALVFFVIPVKRHIFNAGSAVGIVLCMWALCVCIPPVHSAVKSLCFGSLIGKIAFYTVNTGFGLFVLYGAVVTCAMVWAAEKSPAPCATAVVPGAQVKPWGPSTILSGRISAAEGYLKSSAAAKAVLSGGKGSDETISEADCMYNEMTAHGINCARLYKEDKSSNTRENLKFSAEIIAHHNLNENIAIVTDGFHQLRARLICRRLGLRSAVGAVNAKTNPLYVPVYAVREWLALIKTMLS